MVEDRVASIEFDGLAKLCVGVFVVFEFVVNHALGVVNRRKGGIYLDELIEAAHGFNELLLAVIAQAQMIEAVHVGWIYLQCIEVVLFFLFGMAQFLVAVRSVIICFEITCIIRYLRGFSSIAFE